MSGTRIKLDLYFKDKTPQQVNEDFPQLLPNIKLAKKRATRINDGKPNEEMTVKAGYHFCTNEELMTCEPEVEI